MRFHVRPCPSMLTPTIVFLENKPVFMVKSHCNNAKRPESGKTVSTVYLSLGSNLSDRTAHLRAALAYLEQVEGVMLTAVSHCYETEPLGRTDQPAFLNLAAEICTALSPMELLNAVKGIEARLGREPSERWAPRIIDIDVILWEHKELTTERLTLPHKSFRERAFVLVPLAEIAPGAVDPVTGKTVAELARSAEARGRTEKREKLSP